MGTWYDTQFKNIGDVSKNVDIPITLSCAAGTNIKATVTSSAGYIDVNTGKLKLSGTNPATGIGIQLLDKNNNPIKLNTKNSLQNQVGQLNLCCIFSIFFLNLFCCFSQRLFLFFKSLSVKISYNV